MVYDLTAMRTEVPRQSLCKVYFKLEGVSETEIGLNEVV
jgi:hypothetical protein